MNYGGFGILFVVVVIIVGVGALIHLIMKWGSFDGKRPTFNIVIYGASTIVALISLSCIPFGLIIELMCVFAQACLLVLAEVYGRNHSETEGLWYPSRSDGHQDTLTSVMLVVTTMIVLISFAVAIELQG